MLGEGFEGVDEEFSGRGFEDELPGETAGAALMKGGGGGRDFEIFMFLERSVGGLDFFQGSFFGFIGDRETGEMEKRREVGFLTVFGEIFGELREVGF